MTSGIGVVEIKRSQGHLVVRGLGKTARGQNFIRGTVKLSSKNTASPEFKEELANAVIELFAQQELPI